MTKRHMIFLLNWMLKAMTFIGIRDVELERDIRDLLKEVK